MAPYINLVLVMLVTAWHHFCNFDIGYYPPINCKAKSFAFKMNLKSCPKRLDFTHEINNCKTVRKGDKGNNHLITTPQAYRKWLKGRERCLSRTWEVIGYPMSSNKAPKSSLVDKILLGDIFSSLHSFTSLSRFLKCVDF